MENHLIIGLGGTGGKVIRALRKTIFQEFRGDPPPQVNIQYLYVDSDQSMMRLDHPDWKILGHSVQLDKNQQLSIQGDADLASHLDNINSLPGIKGWIGDRAQWKEILNGIIGDVLGGQKRRLGRFLLASKINDFNKQVQNLVRDLRENGGTRAVTFHVCCGLAGGTGSGSVIDVLAQVRSMYPQVGEYRIIVYALLPDTQPKPGWDTGNYHANGYAALLELNALSIGELRPYDITGEKGRLNLQDPFNGCYLFFNENENGLSVDVDTDIPHIVADFLYQKLIAVHSIGWDTLRRMENAENGDGTPELAPGSQQPVRSKRFLTFGIKRLAIPEEEIREYITYCFAHQASLQMLYNNWVDSVGYSDDSKKEAYAEVINDKETRQRWRLSNDHLTLSVGILSSEVNNKKWKPIGDDWQNLTNQYKQYVRESEPASWLDKLQTLCEQRFDTGYREHGVRRFYEIKAANRKEQAKDIRQGIEHELFESWQNGNRSLDGVVGLIDALIDSLEEWQRAANEFIVRYKESSEQANDKINENKATWANIGMISAAFGKRDRLIDAQAECLREKYTNATQMHAWIYAKELLQLLKAEIGDFRSEVTGFRSVLSEALKEFQSNVGQRCKDEDRADFRKPIIRFYKPTEVKNFTNILILDDKVQSTQASRVRETLIARLGEQPSFSSFNKQMFRQTLMDTITASCEKEAINAHNNLISSQRGVDSQFNVSIIEKLAKEYSGNEEGLKKFIHDLSNCAGNYLSFSRLEVNRKSAGIPVTPTKVGEFTVILPKAPDQSSFVNQLKSIFKGSRNENVQLIECESNPREIAFVSITNLFPLRFVEQVSFLKGCYDALIKKANTRRTEIELHCEGSGTDYPALFVESGDTLKKIIRPYILIASALDIIKPFTDPTTGKSELLMQIIDENGYEADKIRLGANLVESADRVDHKEAEMIRRLVDQRLEQEYRHINQQEDLKKKILGQVNAIKAEREGNINDSVYQDFNEAGRTAAKIITETGGG